jgi:hypothetical protein
MAEDFETLLEEALADPERADFARLRMAYARSLGYLPFGREQGEIEELHRRMAAERWEEALDLVELLLESDPLSIPLRFAYAHVLEEDNDELEAGMQRTFGNGLLRAVLASGDGRSAETAIHVLDMREMYLVLDVMGLRAIRSQLIQVGTEWIDQVGATGGEGDRDVYFNVSIPQGWLAEVQEHDPGD